MRDLSFKSFVEMCGRHPFATGLFALLGVAGLLFSFFTFGMEQYNAAKNDQATAELQSTIQRVEKSVAELPRAEIQPEGFIPLKVETPGWSTDNVFFQKAHMGREMQWILENDPESFSELYATEFTLRSVSAKAFVEFAPYLLVDVNYVAPIPQELAGIYQGERGAGAEVYLFSAAIVPVAGLQFAPLVDAESGELRSDVDYFKLMPGESEELVFSLNFPPGHLYSFRVGIQYRYEGKRDIFWLTGYRRMGMPNYELPMAGFNETDFKVGVYANASDGAWIYEEAGRYLAHVRASHPFNPDQLELPIAHIPASPPSH